MKQRSTTRFLLEGLEGGLVTLGVLATWPLSRRWLNDWGARRHEQQESWPGDRLVSAGATSHTRGIDIAAPASRVWQWVVQFGLGRAGFYSYELLERLAGIPVVNLESIETELQSLSEGDEIKLHPRAAVPVALLQEGHHICFGQDPQTTPPQEHQGRCWAMYMVPVSEQRCRLLVRACFEPPGDAGLMKRVAAAVEEPIDFAMEQRMLRTIKRLAEA